MLGHIQPAQRIQFLAPPPSDSLLSRCMKLLLQHRRYRIASCRLRSSNCFDNGASVNGFIQEEVEETNIQKENEVERAYPFQEIEANWQRYWEENKTFRTPNEIDASKSKFYVLDMFPYPSGAGLHVGHPLGYWYPCKT